MIPRVVINVNEIPYQNNEEVSFTPAIILKTLTGPVGEANVVTTYDEFCSIYGVPTSETAVAYGVSQYLQDYQRIYITRLVSEDSTVATVLSKLLDEESTEITETTSNQAIELFEATTNYKTKIYNGDKIEIVYDSTAKSIYFVGELYGEVYTTIREPIDLSTATAVDYENAMDAITDSFNTLGSGVTIVNKYKNKTVGDTVPKATDLQFGILSGGNSGLEAIDYVDNTNDNKFTVKKALELYNTIEISINAILFPEFETYDAVVYASELGDLNRFFILTAPTADSADGIINVVSKYPTCQHLVNYLDQVYLEDSEILVPANIAALAAWAATYKIGPYLAPAGISRALLSRVTKLRRNWTYDEVDELYNYSVPVNPIEFKSARGYVVWGQKTNAPENVYTGRVDGTALIDYIVNELNYISQPYLFESITSNTFSRWTLDATQLLAPLVTATVITQNYTVVMDSTNNTQETIAANQLIGTVTIQKVGVAEEIVIDFSVTRED